MCLRPRIQFERDLRKSDLASGQVWHLYTAQLGGYSWPFLARVQAGKMPHAVVEYTASSPSIPTGGWSTRLQRGPFCKLSSYGVGLQCRQGAALHRMTYFLLPPQLQLQQCPIWAALHETKPGGEMAAIFAILRHLKEAFDMSYRDNRYLIASLELRSPRTIRPWRKSGGGCARSLALPVAPRSALPSFFMRPLADEFMPP